MISIIVEDQVIPLLIAYCAEAYEFHKSKKTRDLWVEEVLYKFR